MRVMLAIVFSVIAPFTLAQTGETPELVLEELRWVDNGFLERQRQQIDEIVRGEFGTRLQGNKSDLRSLSRILEEGLINRTEQQKLQAMGVVLGDIFVNELKMQWRVYLDAEGKSRAVCVPDSEHCLFPITMISKRMEAGAVPDPYELYERGEELMKPYLPRLPYSKR